jgi:hypothetical protein
VLYPGWRARDAIIHKFRRAICARSKFVPFPHQLDYWLAAEGKKLLYAPPLEGQEWALVRLADDSVTKMGVGVRPQGPARVLASLGSFKIGKTVGSALFAASFGIVPGAKIKLIGRQYDICQPEFDAILEFLLSDEGMQMPYESLHNRPNDGRMSLRLENGAEFQARSWERSDTLKGKEDDIYLYCEAFLLGGIECYTSFKQNLKARNGYGVFATTPDRPWVEILHEHGHGDPTFPDWHCVCGTHRAANPYTYDAAEMKKDDPTRGGLMTREQYGIHWLGQFGHWAGSVYGYRKGDRVFDHTTHPEMFTDDKGKVREATPDNLNLPKWYELIGGFDHGTYWSAMVCAVNENNELFVLYEYPNYHYVANTIERIENYGLNALSRDLETTYRHLGVSGIVHRGDPNSQWKRELGILGITARNGEPSIDRRVEILRQAFDDQRVFLAPWLTVLPKELEWARYPSDESISGNNKRVKTSDHTLDCLEHAIAARVMASAPITPVPTSPIIAMIREAKRLPQPNEMGDPHLG